MWPLLHLLIIFIFNLKLKIKKFVVKTRSACFQLVFIKYVNNSIKIKKYFKFISL